MEKRLVLGIAPAERFILSIVLDSTIRDLNLPLSIQIISWFYSSSNWPYPAYKLGQFTDTFSESQFEYGRFFLIIEPNLISSFIQLYLSLFSIFCELFPFSFFVFIQLFVFMAKLFYYNRAHIQIDPLQVNVTRNSNSWIYFRENLNPAH